MSRNIVFIKPLIAALHALDNPEVLFYVMFGMTVVAWVLVILLLAGVI